VTRSVRRSASFDVHFARNSPFGVGLKYFAYVFFFTKQSKKKWTLTSLIVSGNPAGLLALSGTVELARHIGPLTDVDVR